MGLFPLIKVRSKFSCVNREERDGLTNLGKFGRILFQKVETPLIYKQLEVVQDYNRLRNENVFSTSYFSFTIS